MQAGWIGRVQGSTRLHSHPADTFIIAEGIFFCNLIIWEKDELVDLMFAVDVVRKDYQFRSPFI